MSLEVSNIGKSGGGFDPSNLIGASISSIGGLLVAIDDASARRKLEEKIAKLSLAQKKELEIRLQNVQSDVEKMRILYQTLAIDKNRTALTEISKEKHNGILILSFTLLLLSTVIITVKLSKSHG